jgi:hypothetical protein
MYGERGHFVIAEAEWLIGDEQRPIAGVERIRTSLCQTRHRVRRTCESPAFSAENLH